MEALAKGPEQLKTEILKEGRCVSCGACVELCPYIKVVQDRVAVIHNCGISDGNCYKVCPRTYTDYDDLAGRVAGEAADRVLGGYRELYQARAVDPECSGRGQYGGVVTALAVLALESGRCGAALLTASGGLYPRAVLARSRAEVIAAAGSKYGLCPGLAGLNGALRLGFENLLVTGRPCQVAALRKMQHYSTVPGRERIGLVLGLFCFWGLDYAFYRALKEERGVERIDRADIPKEEGLWLDTDRGRVVLTLEETRSYVREGCRSCIDPTAELADLSVGSTESDPKWCTLLVRTEAGAALVEQAAAAGTIETRPCPEEAAVALRAAVMRKKRRVLAGEDEDGTPLNNSYVGLAEESRSLILGEGER